MLSTTYAGLRYPSLDDVDINQAAKDLLSDIEYRNAQNAARINELKRSRGCWLQSNTSVNAPSGTTVTCTFDTELLDTDNFANLGVSNTTINLVRGVWLITSSILLTCGTDMGTTQMEVLLNGATYASVANGPYQGNALPSSLTTLYRATGAATLTVQAAQFNGSATVGHVVFSDLQVARIGIL